MMAKKRVLSWLVAASLALSLLPTAVLATGEDTVKQPLPDLEAADETVVPTEDPYKPPYDDAKEADRLDGEELDEVNDKIEEAADTANSEIDAANSDADTAAETANTSLEEINAEIKTQNDAATNAAKEANDAANDAKNESLSLEEREEAARKAEEAAQKAEEAAQKADEQVTAAQGVVDAAQRALDDANTAYQDALNKANALLENAGDDLGLKAQAQKLIDDAEGKVNDAKAGLTTAQEEFGKVEKARGDAWDASEVARIAANAAAVAAKGQDKVIDSAKEEHSQGFVDSKKEQVDNSADAAISAKELENAAQTVVDAQTKADDLNNLQNLTEEQKKLAEAKKAYDEADKALNGYTDENGNHVKGAQEIAKETKDRLPSKDINYDSYEDWKDSWADANEHNLSNIWLDYHLDGLLWKPTRREIVNALLDTSGADHSKILTEENIKDVLSAAKKSKVNYINKVGQTIETLRTARADLATEQDNLNTAVNEVKTVTGITNGNAQQVLDALNGKIQNINTNGKYNEDLKDLSTAISAANTALDDAKQAYTEKGGELNVTNLDEAKKALNDASNAYSAAIDALNTAAGTKLSSDTATIEALNQLKVLKEQVETAKSLIAEMERTKGVYEEKEGLYNTAKEKAQSAKNQYEAAKKAVDEAEENLKKAEVSSVEFTAQDLESLNAALAAARQALADAEILKNKAQTDLDNARRDADDARDAYDDAARRAEEILDDITGTDGDTADDDDTAATIEDGIVPLALMPTRGELMNYLYVRVGSPAAQAPTFTDVPADHEFAAAIGWAQANGIAVAYEDGTFDPDNFVIAADLTAFLTRYADFAGMTMPALTAMAGLEDDAIVENADEILAEFFGA